MATDTALASNPAREGAHAEPMRSGPRFAPHVDIFEQGAEITVLADLPGATLEGIDINFEKGLLTLYGKVKVRQPEGARCLLREYRTGDYYRSFEVGVEIDSSRISAELHNGVLTLHLPKIERAKSRKIPVQRLLIKP